VIQHSKMLVNSCLQSSVHQVITTMLAAK